MFTNKKAAGGSKGRAHLPQIPSGHGRHIRRFCELASGSGVKRTRSPGSVASCSTGIRSKAPTPRHWATRRKFARSGTPWPEPCAMRPRPCPSWPRSRTASSRLQSDELGWNEPEVGDSLEQNKGLFLEVIGMKVFHWFCVVPFLSFSDLAEG